jgi:AcrR family transcriptional regulator
VASERTSAGDPARTLALLWRLETAPRRGPGRGLDLETVIGTAIGLADREGLSAVSMRRLAQELGVSTMTLYTYVPGKAELLDLMLDRAYQRLPLSDLSGRPWRERLTVISDDNRQLFLDHPWAVEVSTMRPPLGPGLMAKYEYELSTLEGLALTDLEMDDALTFVLSFVQSNARAALDAHAAQRESAMSDAQWWEVNGPLLSRVLDESAYPVASRVGSAAGEAHGSAHDPEHAYRFGLERVLDGLAPLIERRS